MSQQLKVGAVLNKNQVLIPIIHIKWFIPTFNSSSREKPYFFFFFWIPGHVAFTHIGIHAYTYIKIININLCKNKYIVTVYFHLTMHPDQTENYYLAFQFQICSFWKWFKFFFNL